MTPTTQSIVNGQARPAERDRLAERIGEHVEAEAELEQQAGDRELDEELLGGVRAAHVVVNAQAGDDQAAEKQTETWSRSATNIAPTPVE